MLFLFYFKLFETSPIKVYLLPYDKHFLYSSTTRTRLIDLNIKESSIEKECGALSFGQKIRRA